VKKLAIITTHPIQYYAPVFKLLAKNCSVKVFYTLGEKVDYDHGFKQAIDWDIPLLEGYDFEFVENIAKEPGSHHYKGVNNPTLVDKVSEFNPDAILTYGWSYHSHFKVLRHFKNKISVWFRGDSNLLDEKTGIKKLIRRIFLTWVYRNIDKAFYVGKANKAYYQALGLQPDELIFAPHAVDNDRFTCERSVETEQIKRELGIEDGDILIVFAGKFEEKKDPEILLSAFMEVNNPNAHLLFVGNGDLKQRLKSKVEEDAPHGFGITKRVHFMDFQNQSQMPAIYQTCDLFCLPSKGPGETWGLAVNEAMASGRAILISNKVGCAEDLVVNGVNGFIFEAGNKAELVARLHELIKNPSRLEEMGKQSSQIIKNWTIQIQSQTIINELNAIK
jgi:glycosyltransferase involved in cell wall biosynthesis